MVKMWAVKGCSSENAGSDIDGEMEMGYGLEF